MATGGIRIDLQRAQKETFRLLKRKRTCGSGVLDTASYDLVRRTFVVLHYETV